MAVSIPIDGVSVRVVLKTSASPVPFGREFNAKGFYFQGKYIVTVGAIAAGGSKTVRIKYLRKEIESLTVL